MIIHDVKSGKITYSPKYRVGDYVEWESPLGIYCGMIRAWTYEHSVAGGARTWYDINQQQVEEHNILARLVREEYADTRDQHTRQSHDLESHERCGDRDRTGCHLTQGHPINELPGRKPSVYRTDLILNEGDGSIPSAKDDGTDLQKYPGQLQGGF